MRQFVELLTSSPQLVVKELPIPTMIIAISITALGALFFDVNLNIFVSEPIKRSYGRPYSEFMVKLAPAMGQGAGAYAPHMTGIVEWDQGDDYFILSSNEQFKTEAAPLLAQAVAKMDMVQTKIVIRQ